jgi:hypothetical protein
MGTPALDLLLGPRAADVLAAAIAEYGGRLENLRPANADVRPNGAAVITYWAELFRADGARTREILAATTGSRIPAGAAVLAGEHGGEPVEVGIWRWPQDPALPALATANDPVLLAAMFRDLGISTASVLDVRARAYRPAQRAVLEVYDGRQRWFVKVVRPSTVSDLRTRHELTSPHLPVPPVLASTPEGMVVLPEARGTSLRTLIVDGADALPSPAALESTLDVLPAELLALPAHQSHLQRVEHYAGVLRCAADDEPTVLSRVDELVDELLAVELEPEATVPVHGDFYEGQLLAEGGRVTGVIDMDTAGPGQRSDEWATLLAHLSGLDLDAGCRATARQYAAAVIAHADQRVRPRQLRQRTAAALLGLATGPFRVQQDRWPENTAARLELAQSWLASAR